jgi:ubiquinone/menaquinone biosynthesis C-methylase UbiE
VSLQRGYQYHFSEILPEAMYNRKGREKKAKTMIAILRDYLGKDLNFLSLLDIGCSTGIITSYLANHFGQVVGIDIDDPAIHYARKHFKKDNLKFEKNESDKMQFSRNTFDVVICAHIYEHVPDADQLMQETYRVLKANGVCYFAAGNRVRLMEPHYQLPFLSIIPRPLAHAYIRLAGRSKFYYEKHLSYWGLKKLVRHFEIIDYTRHLIEQPNSFGTDYMIQANSNKARLARFITKYAYWLCPTYVWLLRKSGVKNY